MAKRKIKVQQKDNYSSLVADLSGILESARKYSARSINAILTAAYWLIGFRVSEYELKGLDRADYYGDKLIEKISKDLSKKFGKGFSKRNIFLMRSFYLTYSDISRTSSGKSFAVENIRLTLSGKSHINKISQTLSAQSNLNRNSKKILQTPSAQSFFAEFSELFPLPWSHYVRLLSVKNEQAQKLLLKRMKIDE
ncbi:MAG: DUF1016 N-terminal domain-containing protein [Ignavibacteriaceae bacterium]|jgi:hypothetical protein|nr:DUF1016 N-terminal domain-containing protein [Ignavibacteriaceae bacterium]